MLDCLPTAAEWSPQSQFALMLDHLHALRHHLDELESAATRSAAELITAMPHLEELNSRSHEAHTLLRQLAGQPQDVLQTLRSGGC